MCRLVLFLKILCSTFHHFAQFQPTAAVRFAAMFKREKGITPRECRRVRTDQLPEEKTIA